MDNLGTAPQKNSVYVRLLWLPGDKSKFPVNKLKESILYIDKVLIEESSESKRKTSNDLYEERLLELECELRLDKSLEDCVQSLLCKWCSSSFPTQFWIFPKNLDVFKEKFVPAHKWKKIEYFSLGSIVGLNTFVEHYNCSQNEKGSCKITQVQGYFEHDKEILKIYFCVAKNTTNGQRDGRTHRFHWLVVSYASIQRILISKFENCTKLYMYLASPPLLYAVKAKDKYIPVDEIDSKTPKVRVVQFGEGQNQCTKSMLGKSSVLLIKLNDKEHWEVTSCLFNRCKETPVFFTHMENKTCTKNPVLPPFSSQCFGLKYALKAVFSNSFNVQDQHVDKSILNSYANKNPKALEESLFEISVALDAGNIVLFENALKTLFPLYDIDLSLKNEKLMLVRRVVLTPTRMVLLPPQPYMKSLIFKTNCDAEYALRVSIREDNNMKLTFTIGESEDCLNEIVYKPLIRGLRIAGRKYEVFGCSTSQLRDHGLWLYAEDEKKQTAESIRASLGNLNNIRTISKYMARMGQLFSQARGSLQVSKDCVVEVDDVTGGMHPDSGKPYIFSDGVGKISPNLAKKVYKALNIETCPSAMQVRYGGCKGMLAVDNQLQGEVMHTRPSMKKFEFSSSSLEILNWSHPKPVFLNRQVITILEQLGVPRNVFEKLQEKMLLKLTRSLYDERSALKLLKENSKLKFPFKELASVGVSFLKDPFFRSIIQAIYRRVTLDLIEKSRIEIPIDKGRTMFGILDERSILEYGQIFVQYTELSGIRTVLQGTVVVLKNPCMHPGDVRKFEAVDIPQLHHLVDCVVFPAKGHRPHPDEMSGSDLDGDEYSLFWLDELIFKRLNHSPMDFPSNDSETNDKPVEVADMLKFFTEYIKKDSGIGRVANAHLVWADCEKKGIFSQKCLSKAKDYAQNLDFAKSGICEISDTDSFPWQYPDFMDKLDHKSSYLSKRALGHLYRNCKRIQFAIDTANEKLECDLDTYLLYPGLEEYLESAKEALEKYSFTLRTTMKIFGVESEGELASMCITRLSKYLQERNDMKNVGIVLENQIQYVFESLKKEFYREFSNGSKTKTSDYCLPLESVDKALRKASAWYKVTCEQNKNNFGEANFYGLPWIVADLLVVIRKIQTAKETKISEKQRLIARINSICFSQSIADTFNYPEQNLFLQATKALKLLQWWVHYHSKLFSLSTFCTDVQSYIDRVFKNIMEESWSNLDNVSAGSLVLQCLELMASGGMKSNNARSEKSVTCIEQEAGLIALIMLCKLVYGRIDGLYFKDFDTQTTCDILHVQDEWEVIHLSLYNEQFSSPFMKKEDDVKHYIQKNTGISKIDMRAKHEQGDKWHLLLTVRGCRWSLERVKELVVRPSFEKAIKEGLF
ncbi:RNA-dependent RNA polymerase 1-like [Limulus polyphemus]|uniref:RNA-dependent RNA polymerase n=1 Tax=Limulus polyphemus TaxID=6850 RepID=A0ABM1BUP7_LIMPO|nr:RNA-dependent RNA polymerase 1-like [Limulus polyphemus]XP_022257160.1 RNA-dependent RNA polymerase 1-like [Limulus polyphemus]